MSKEWDKCMHCSGSGKCGCGDCRVYIGSGYSNWEKGICYTCRGEGGRWVNPETGQPFEPFSHPIAGSEKRR